MTLDNLVGRGLEKAETGCTKRISIRRKAK